MAALIRFFFALLVSQFIIGSGIVSATMFTLTNKCQKTIWPGILTGDGGAPLANGGFSLAPGNSNQFSGPPGWSGRFWARTGCAFHAGGNGHCTTGNCPGGLKCTGGGEPPVSLVEFTLGKNKADKDFYDVSLVDGYNVALRVQTSGGSGECQPAGCVDDLNHMCPSELAVVVSGEVVACKSACAAFNRPEYCCTGSHSKPETCPPTKYSQLFKKACPTAYSYAYDDPSSTRTCAGADYVITFCP